MESAWPHAAAGLSPSRRRPRSPPWRQHNRSVPSSRPHRRETASFAPEGRRRRARLVRPRRRHKLPPNWRPDLSSGRVRRRICSAIDRVRWSFTGASPPLEASPRRTPRSTTSRHPTGRSHETERGRDGRRHRGGCRRADALGGEKLRTRRTDSSSGAVGLGPAARRCRSGTTPDPALPHAGRHRALRAGTLEGDGTLHVEIDPALSPSQGSPRQAFGARPSCCRFPRRGPLPGTVNRGASRDPQPSSTFSIAAPTAGPRPTPWMRSPARPRRSSACG